MNPDGSDRKTIITDCHLPDGIVVDADAGHIYWTNMGIPNLDDGSRTARQAKQDFVRFAQELGATPVSRSRVSVSPGGGPSKFGHLIAGKEA